MSDPLLTAVISGDDDPGRNIWALPCYLRFQFLYLPFTDETGSRLNLAQCLIPIYMNDSGGGNATTLLDWDLGISFT